MSLDRRAVDEELRGPPARGECLEEVHPHALRGPADITVVESFARAVEAAQRAPDFSTWTMPLIARRRCLPRDRALLGREPEAGFLRRGHVDGAASLVCAPTASMDAGHSSPKPQQDASSGLAERSPRHVCSASAVTAR